jgi:hypothetical protein
MQKVNGQRRWQANTGASGSARFFEMSGTTRRQHGIIPEDLNFQAEQLFLLNHLS